MKEKRVYNTLRQFCHADLEITWHENRSSILSCQKKSGTYRIRLHRLFTGAPSPVLEALARYLFKAETKAGAIVRQMAHLYFSQSKTDPDPLATQGKYYDLKEIYARLQKQYFSSSLQLAIGWSDERRVGKFRFMTFGSYDQHRDQIRIHPLLDDPAVPLYFLEFVVYHEMLHAICPSQIDRLGRICCHTVEFRKKEREFVDFDLAKAWERKSLEFFRKKTQKRSIPRGRHGRA